MTQTLTTRDGGTELKWARSLGATAGMMLVVVQREWNGWRKALTPLGSLEDVHWHQPQGAPKPLLHGYVSCRSLMSGEVPHDCDGSTPHRLLVCVLRRHTVPSLFDLLAARADERPA